MKLLVTGGCGFIGSNFIRAVLKRNQDWEITNLDLLTYAGNLDNLKEIADNKRYTFAKGSITDVELVNELFTAKPDALINFAAESHVDRSIRNPHPFLKTNIFGTQTLIDAALAADTSRFIQISTDEVYGSLEKNAPPSIENSTMYPSSPYAASKAAADLLVQAACRTHKFPGIIARSSNNYGPFQYPEKLIPLLITNLLEGKQLPVYGDGLQIRDWLHVDDHVEGILAILLKGKPGETYHLGGGNERTNNAIAEYLADHLDTSRTCIQHVRDRPGHDRRYALNIDKSRTDLAWQPKIDFETGLLDTVKWYKDNPDWWKKIKTGEFKSYYKQQYSELQN